ncbi:hypothetical protein [Rugamonas sp.]|uniref:hypothetical protein n=1 Tax=Rugamonas sp. TaxID=1926287 RepID=UPI0025D68CDF|nr:hypothetical protein [Rugamonas sp.]
MTPQEQIDRDRLQQQIDRALQVDPGHVRTRQHYEAMLAERQIEQHQSEQS